MTTNSWATGVSGDWTTASDWTGGIVPEGRNSAVINATPTSSNYTVSVTTPVTVGRLTLDEKSATLLVSGSLASSDFALQSGTLQLDNGSLAGTVVCTGGKFELLNGTSQDSGTLSNLTWRGTLTELDNNSPLTIDGGLTLTPRSGSGIGTANFDGPIILDAVSSLSNALITAHSGISVTATPTFTLSSSLTLTAEALSGPTGTRFINNGTLAISAPASGNGISGFGSVVNNGTLTFNYDNTTLSAASLVNTGELIDAGQDEYYDTPVVINTNSFTNTGTILIAAGDELVIANPQGLQPGGAHSAIQLAGTLQLDGALTTAQLLSFESSNHVVQTGTAGVLSIDGTLNNSAATLTTGVGTLLGDLPASSGEITGGTIVSTDGGGTAGLGNSDAFPSPGLLLNDLTLQSETPTLALNNVSFNGVTISGASTLALSQFASSTSFNGGSLAGVSDLSLVYNTVVTLNDVALGPNTTISSGAPGETGGFITLGAAQSTAGATMQLYGSSLYLDPGETVSQAQINFYEAGPANNLASPDDSSVAATLGMSSTINVVSSALGINQTVGVANPTLIDLQGSLVDNGTVNAGYIDNSGTISGSGTFSLVGEPVTNSGVINLNGGSFLQTSYNTGNGTAVTSLTNTGTIAVTNGGTLALTLTDTINYGSISVTGGTLLLNGALTLPSLTEIASPGSQIGVLGSLDLGGGTVTQGVNGVPDFFVAQGGVSPTAHCSSPKAKA